MHTMTANSLHPPDSTGEFARLSTQTRKATDFLKALAHETRLMILCILAESEKSVGDLERMLGLRQPAVSQQLARLRTDGLVATRRDGKIVYYSLASEEARALVETVYEVFLRTGGQGMRPGRHR